jgi:hypothetical protein
MSNSGAQRLIVYQIEHAESRCLAKIPLPHSGTSYCMQKTFHKIWYNNSEVRVIFKWKSFCDVFCEATRRSSTAIEGDSPQSSRAQAAGALVLCFPTATSRTWRTGWSCRSSGLRAAATPFFDRVALFPFVQTARSFHSSWWTGGVLWILHVISWY